MNKPRLRFGNLTTFKARAEELLDIEWIAKGIYGLYAVVSFTTFYLVLFFLAPARALYMLIDDILKLVIDQYSFWFVVYLAFKILFIPYAHYCVGAYGPGLLRRLLYLIFVQPKLKRMYRENHGEMQKPRRIESRGSFWPLLKAGYSLTLHSLKNVFNPPPARSGYIIPQPATDESSDALSLHHIPLNEEELGDTPRRGNDRNAVDEDSQTQEQHEESQESRERAKRSGAKFGTWVGSKVGAAFVLPLKAAILLGQLSTELGNRVEAMRFLLLQREQRQDLPGDIYLP
ncbi:hypothetical protein B0O99DRAFT_629378 [Bisporella sp. PMI_857]|nr:hypothetical protein B0O99DRAFT_629378 [Bisporella sp. PMI_857]